MKLSPRGKILVSGTDGSRIWTATGITDRISGGSIPLNNDKKKGWGDPPSPRIRRTMEGEIEAKRRFREAEGRRSSLPCLLPELSYPVITASASYHSMPARC